MDDSNKQKMSRSRGFWRVIATLVITAVGIFAGIQLWHRYMLTPWTRDGRVLANSVLYRKRQPTISEHHQIPVISPGSPPERAIAMTDSYIQIIARADGVSG
jgi:hypothetical protein